MTPHWLRLIILYPTDLYNSSRQFILFLFHRFILTTSTNSSTTGQVPFGVWLVADENHDFSFFSSAAGDFRRLVFFSGIIRERLSA